ncbi:uncharacterized protein ACBT57_000188 [Dama dama]
MPGESVSPSRGSGEAEGEREGEREPHRRRRGSGRGRRRAGAGPGLRQLWATGCRGASAAPQAGNPVLHVGKNLAAAQPQGQGSGAAQPGLGAPDSRDSPRQQIPLSRSSPPGPVPSDLGCSHHPAPAKSGRSLQSDSIRFICNQEGGHSRGSLDTAQKGVYRIRMILKWSLILNLGETLVSLLSATAVPPVHSA